MNWQTSRTIHLYVLKEVLLVTSLSTLALCALLLYANLTKHDEALLQALSSSPSALIELISLLLPYALSMGLPFGFSLAVLFCVGRWASDNELTALDSLGINPSGWKFTIYGLSLVICLICCGASLIWAPLARAQFDERKRELAWILMRQAEDNRNEKDSFWVWIDQVGTWAWMKKSKFPHMYAQGDEFNGWIWIDTELSIYPKVVLYYFDPNGLNTGWKQY